MAKKDGTENLGLGNCECTNDNIVSQEDREVKEDVQDDTKIGTQGGSVATGAIPKKRSSKPPNVEWANQTSSIINIDLVSEDVNARPKDVMVTGRQAVVYQNTQPTKRRAASAPKVTLEEKHHSIKHPGYPSSLINQQPPIHDSTSCKPSIKAENLPPLGGLWEAVKSEEDVGNSRQDTKLNVTATSQSDTTMKLAPRCSTLEENDIIRMQNLKKELSSLKHDLRKKTEELLHATTQAEECRSRCAQLEEQMEERGIANESYAIRISNLQRRYEELQSHVVEIGIAMADKNETIRILQEECERLRERVPVPIPEDVD